MTNQNSLLKRFGKKVENLSEVKCGETGVGLLLEHDGHIIGNADMVSQIKEDISHHKEFVIPDKFIVNAIFQKYGIKNANGRVYPESILKREVEKYINEKVRLRASVGALDHPNESTLSGHDISHIITSLQWQGHTLIGEMQLHLSPGYRRYGIASTSGDLVANMVLDDILIGVSSRGVGSVDDRYGVLEVGDDFELLCWDVVCEPSTPNAFISRNLEDLRQFVEANENNLDKPQVNEKIERINKILL